MSWQASPLPPTQCSDFRTQVILLDLFVPSGHHWRFIYLIWVFSRWKAQSLGSYSVAFLLIVSISKDGLPWAEWRGSWPGALKSFVLFPFLVCLFCFVGSLVLFPLKVFCQWRWPSWKRLKPWSVISKSSLPRGKVSPPRWIPRVGFF